MESMAKKIKIKDFEFPLASRLTGKRLREKALSFLEEGEATSVVFDFSGVEYLSTGVARDLFGELWIILGKDFKTKVGFEFDSNKKIILSSIARGIKAAEKANNT